MINNVGFTGRETMLTKGLEKAAEKLESTFVKASTVLEPLPQKAVVETKAVYTSPFANIVTEPASEIPVVNRTGLNFFA